MTSCLPNHRGCSKPRLLTQHHSRVRSERTVDLGSDANNGAEIAVLLKKYLPTTTPAVVLRSAAQSILHSCLHRLQVHHQDGTHSRLHGQPSRLKALRGHSTDPRCSCCRRSAETGPSDGLVGCVPARISRCTAWGGTVSPRGHGSSGSSGRSAAHITNSHPESWVQRPSASPARRGSYGAHPEPSAPAAQGW